MNGIDIRDVAWVLRQWGWLMGPVFPKMKAAAKGRLAGRPAIPAELHDDPSQILFLILRM
jgi:hypothetical protein